MIDLEQLFDSLEKATEFTVTEAHLKLVRHLSGGGVHWMDECYGTPYFDMKRPYGNSDVPKDVAEIVGAPDSDWEIDEELAEGGSYTEDELKRLRPEAEDRYLRLHVETAIALWIVLAVGEFRPGRYIRSETWTTDWQLAES